MAFRIRDLSIHLLPDGGAGNCTCTPASPREKPKPPCEGPTCKASGPPNPGGKPKPSGPPKKRSGLATLQAQLRKTLAPPSR